MEKLKVKLKVICLVIQRMNEKGWRMATYSNFQQKLV
jgi:hypothetical protein